MLLLPLLLLVSRYGTALRSSFFSLFFFFYRNDNDVDINNTTYLYRIRFTRILFIINPSIIKGIRSLLLCLCLCLCYYYDYGWYDSDFVCGCETPLLLYVVLVVCFSERDVDNLKHPIKGRRTTWKWHLLCKQRRKIRTTQQPTDKSNRRTAEERCFWQLESFRLLLCYHWMRKLRLFLLDFMRKDIWTLTNPWKGTPVSEYLCDDPSSVRYFSSHAASTASLLFCSFYVLLLQSNTQHITQKEIIGAHLHTGSAATNGPVNIIFCGGAPLPGILGENGPCTVTDATTENGDRFSATWQSEASDLDMAFENGGKKTDETTITTTSLIIKTAYSAL